jgi:carboxyl-terminal processing protease
MKKGFVVLSAIFVVMSMAFLVSPQLRVVANDRYQDLQIFTKVLNLVQQYYVEEVDTKKLIYGGVKGILRELDPHTNFLPPDLFKEFESETSGEFGGLGIEITVQGGILTVLSPIEDTPAWQAGIKAGDRIVSINGESTKGMTLVEAAQRMRGKKGSPVTLGIFREGFEKPQDFKVVRGTVKIRSIKYTDLEEGYAYIKVTHFIDQTVKDFKAELNKHVNKYKSVKGLVIDLRKNPGGLLDQAVQMSDLFLSKGNIVSTIGRNKNEPEIITAKLEGTLPEFPVVVLIDEHSASASEIVAGALQDNKRAVIMGQRSFGKGSVQSVVKLGDGSGLKLTVARYYTPSGRSIQAEGIQPDIILDNLSQEIIEKARIQSDVRRERDIKGHLVGDKEKEELSEESDEKLTQFLWSEPKKKEKKLSAKDQLLSKDYQAQQAFNYLKTWALMRP